jgi:hypothetical protein
MVKRFMPGTFRCKRSVEAIISKTMKRYLGNLEIPYNLRTYFETPDFAPRNSFLSVNNTYFSNAYPDILIRELGPTPSHRRKTVHL